MKYKYIIFDCFGTLVDDSDIAQKSKELREELTEVENLIYRAHRNDWQRSGYSLEKFMSDIKNTNVFSDNKIKLIRDRVTFESFNLFPDTVPALKLLKESGYGLVILSNAMPIAKKLYENKQELNGLIDDAFWSFELGCTKPEKQIFNLVLDALNCKKEEAVYIGDSYENDYLGAKNAGVTSVLLDRQNKFNIVDCVKSLSEFSNLV